MQKLGLFVLCSVLISGACSAPASVSPTAAPSAPQPTVAPAAARPTAAAAAAQPTTAPAAAAKPTAAPAAAQPTTAPAAAGTCALPPCDKSIVVGVSQALTGDKADPGTAIEHGYEVWVKEMNDAGGLLGRKVELKVYDNQSLADTAVSQYERLITGDKVDLLFGPFSTALTVPTSAVAEKYKMAFVEGAGGAPTVFDRKFHYLFFVQPATAEKQADPFVDWVLAMPPDKRPKTAAYPQQDDPFVSATEDGAQARFEAAGIKTVYKQVYPPTQTDFSSIGSAVKASGADLLVAGTLYDDAVGQIQAYITVGYQPQAAYFTSGPDTTGPFQEALGPKTEGVLAGEGWFQESAEPANAKFVADYLALFPTEDSVPGEAAEGYSAAQVTTAAVMATRTLDNTKLADWLHANKVQTVQGLIGWDDLGRPSGSFFLAQWQAGKIHVVAPSGDPNKNAEPQFPKPTW